MQNVILVVHLILAISLIGIVLLQRSEGGGLGMGGGGGGGGGLMTGRQAANALSRVTWILAVAFIATSLALTVIAARDAATSSVADRLAPSGSDGADTGAPAGESLLPPAPAEGPVTPPAADGPATPPPAQ